MSLAPKPGPPLVASFVADLPANLDPGEVTTLHVDHLGAPYLVAERTEADTLPTWRLTEAGEWEFRAIPSNGMRRARAAPLPGGVWLLVDAWPDAGPNARVLDRSGTVTREFRVGDCFNDIQVTRDGSLWVSYCDEGVYGDDLGQAGLLRFDLTGNITFRFADLPDLPFIDDCYALNVVSDRETWVCYYSDFPVVQIVDGKLGRVWKNMAPGGPSTFAVGKQSALFGPGYKPDDQLTLIDLDRRKRSKHPVATPDGRVKTLKQGRYRARGSSFFFCDDVLNRLLVVDLSALTFG